MNAVVLGTGRIACGCAGQMLRAAGFDLVFIGRNQAVVDNLDRLGRYRVRLADNAELREIEIDRVRAIWIGDRDAAVEAIASADVIVSAVGVNNLSAVAPVLATGLAQRTTAVNVLAFENLADAGARLGELVSNASAPDAVLCHGFASVLVERVVSVCAGDPLGAAPLVFIGDPWPTVRVDRSGLRRALPPIAGMIVTDRFEAWVHRKLYTYSAGHATAAYLGHLKGYHYVHTAVTDPEIRSAVIDAMAEGQRGLLARYGAEIAGSPGDLPAIVARFENAALSDPVRRVGRDPRRKLGGDERLIGAARLAEAAGVKPDRLALATAAALYFDSSDPSAAELQREMHTTGAGATVTHVSGLNTRRGVGRLIVSDCRQLARGWQPGNLALSLAPLMWSWAA